ncbi:MAG: sugar transferase [Sedimentitalea sp.]|nr:sugar transferase [Sedimentitalea sp.]
MSVMFESIDPATLRVSAVPAALPPARAARDRLSISPAKRITDLCFILVALPGMVLVALLLVLMNPVLNPGPLFFRQDRMGLGGRRFRMWKFRTMLPDPAARLHDAPVELHRITPLGRFLRRTRIDELPNALNVIAGDMSLVGPRPDVYDHAAEYLRSVRHYRHRLAVRPGITGLAQVQSGYADSRAAIRRKARLDRFYVERAQTGLDLYILLRTVPVMLTGFGAK